MPDIYTDFSGRDYTATLEWLYAMLQQDVPELTDFNHSDAGITLTRLVARALDQSNFYTDQVFAEGYKDSCRFKQSLINVAKLVDVLPKLASASSTELTVTRTGNAFYLGQELTIPKGTEFYRSDNITYVSLEDLVIPIGTTSASIEVFQGSLQQRTLTDADFSYTDLSGHLKCNLGKNVAARTVTLIHGDDDQPWEEVESFYRSVSTSLHYRLEVFADEYEGETDTVFLVLGNGTKGSSYPGSPMTIQYVLTDGPEGNTGANTITQMSSIYSAMVSVTNASPSTGGSLTESMEDFRQRIPDTVSIQRRGVSKPDYPEIVKPIAGVGDCQVTDRNTDPEYPWEYICLYVVPSGGGSMSPELTRAVYARLTEKGGLGGWRGRYILKDAVPVTIPVTCRVNITTGYSTNTVSQALRTAISALFLIQYGAIGSLFSFSDLNVAASRVAGVNWIEFDTPRDNIQMADGEYPVVGAITITVS